MKFTSGTTVNSSTTLQRLSQSFPYSFTIWNNAGTYRAESNIAGVDDVENADAGIVINGARDACDNGESVFIRNGVYECTTPIQSNKLVNIFGESMGFENNFATGTVLKYIGGAADAFIDMREYTCNLQNLKLKNEGSATRGVYVGAATNISGKGKGLDWQSVYIDGFSYGIQGTNFGPDDSCFTNIFVGNATTCCVDHLSSMCKFFGGSLYVSPIGVRVRQLTVEETGIQFFGTIMSSCDTAIDIYGTNNVYGGTLTNCWIEGSNILLDTSNQTAAQDFGHWLFDNCVMTINAAPNQNFMDLRGRNGWVKIEGGTCYHVGETAGYILTDGAGATEQVVSANVYAGRNHINFTDLNSGLRGHESSTFALHESAGYQPGAPIGAAYASMSGIQDHTIPWRQYVPVKATVIYKWNPKTASGKVRLFYGGAGYGAAEPAAGDAIRRDAVDISSFARITSDYGAEVAVQAADDNATAPIFYSIQIVYEW